MRGVPVGKIRRRHRHERNNHDRDEAQELQRSGPGPWRKNWDLEIYAIDVVDKFADEPGIWRTLVESLNNIPVDSSKTEALSVESTAVILEKDIKHKL